MEARNDDESLEHMMRDIEYGDGVVKILDELAKEDTKEATSDEAKAEAKDKSESFDFEDAETSATSPAESISSPSEPVSTTQPTVNPETIETPLESLHTADSNPSLSRFSAVFLAFSGDSADRGAFEPQVSGTASL